jgi:hypothetical protein
MTVIREVRASLEADLPSFGRSRDYPHIAAYSNWLPVCRGGGELPPIKWTQKMSE